MFTTIYTERKTGKQYKATLFEKLRENCTLYTLTDIKTGEQVQIPKRFLAHSFTKSLIKE